MHPTNKQHEPLTILETTYHIQKGELKTVITHPEYPRDLLFNMPVLICPLSQNSEVYIDNNRPFLVRKQECIIVAKKTLIHLDSSSSKPAAHLILCIPHEKITEILFFMNKHVFPTLEQEVASYSTNCLYNKDSVVYELAMRLHKVMSRADTTGIVFADLIQKELLIRIVLSGARGVLMEQKLTGQHSRLRVVLNFIKENLDRSISIHELAEKACMSQSNFYKAFKQAMELSPLDYINREKVALAKKMLNKTDKSIADICQDCGYNNMNYFVRQFKKYEDVTPKQYTQQLLEVHYA